MSWLQSVSHGDRFKESVFVTFADGGGRLLRRCLGRCRHAFAAGDGVVGVKVDRTASARQSRRLKQK